MSHSADLVRSRMLLAETQDWIVLDKPAGWLSIAPSSDETGTPSSSAPILVDWARGQFRKVWVVHRLDLQTSGVILLARNEETHRRANAWFQNHEVQKCYDCLSFLPEGGVAPLPVFKVQSPVRGKASVTQFEVTERFQGALWISARPLSGRRHQIRIHLAEKGLPLLGDPTYGGPTQAGALAISRVALHARALVLPSGERFEAPWPEDFSEWVSQLRGFESRN